VLEYVVSLSICAMLLNQVFLAANSMHFPLINVCLVVYLSCNRKCRNLWHSGLLGRCRPHYFHLYEVRPPASSSYIYELRLIKE